MDPTPREVGGTVWAKYVARWLIALAGVAILAAVLVMALGLSFVALFPVLLVAIGGGLLYMGFRDRQMRHGQERHARDGYVDLVGGADARSPAVDGPEAGRDSSVRDVDRVSETRRELHA